MRNTVVKGGWAYGPQSHYISAYCTGTHNAHLHCLFVFNISPLVSRCISFCNHFHKSFSFCITFPMSTCVPMARLFHFRFLFGYDMFLHLFSRKPRSTMAFLGSI